MANRGARATAAVAIGLAAAALLVAARGVDGQVQTRRAMTIRDLLTAVRVTEPTLSSDGRQVAYVRTTTDLESGKRSENIYIVPADGSAAPRPLAVGATTGRSPVFSPDAGQIAFISTGDGAPQVFIVGVGGGEPRRVTKLSDGVQPPLVFSPDGRRVAFVSDVFPECRDDECNRSRAEALEKDPVKVRRLTKLMFRHWNEWRDTRRHHVFVADVEGGGVRDLTPGDFDAPPHNDEDGGIAFSADGQQLAFVSKREGRDAEAWSTNTDVWLTPVTGGDLRKLTPNPAGDNAPVFTRDGRSIVVRAQRRAGFESDRWYLDVYGLQDGTKHTVFDSPDLSVDEFRLSPDGGSIWFTAAEEGRENLFVVPFGGGAPERVASGGEIASINPASGFVVYAKSTMTTPSELFRSSRDGSGAKSLTSENASWLKDVAPAEPESLTVHGGGGASIQYWLLKPPGFSASQKYRTVFLIHGGPQGAWSDGWSSRWNPVLWAAQGWVVAAPNPRGSTGFGQKFVDEVSQDWGGRAMRDLDAVFSAVARLPFVDADHLGIAGASYGGYAVNWIVGHTNRFKAAVSHDGVFNLESMAYETEELWFTDWEFGGPPWSAKARENFAKWSPHLHADRMKTPTLVITNELDFRVPVGQGLQLFTALRRNGVPAEALVFPDEGHWVLKPLNSWRWHEAVFEWMRRYL
jgi:dipeptidyl aminopeptidase/acylaminoacyl peptidase